jgi:serine phosphatase RsbU (regulator of sigma subunit)
MKNIFQRSGTISIATLILAITLCYFHIPASYGQQLRPLSQTNQERVERLEELVSYHLNQNDISSALSSMNQISYIYWENGRPDKAIQSFERTARYYEQINDLENLHTIYSIIGLIQLDLEDIPGANRAFVRQLDVRRRIGDQQGIASALVDLAQVKSLMAEHREAIGLLEEALEIALRLNYETILPHIYNQLANSYMSINNIRQGEEYRRKYNDIREHLARQSMRGQYEESTMQSQVEARLSQEDAEKSREQIKINQLMFQLEQDSIKRIVQEREDSLELAQLRAESQMREIERIEQERELDRAEIERRRAVQNFQQLIIYSTAGGLVLVLLLALIAYRGYKAKQKINKQLETKNHQIQLAQDKLQEAFIKIEDQNYRITQSISYAREIQKALFPPQKTLNSFIPESFIFFQPVDMVSGDFYWFREMESSTISSNRESENNTQNKEVNPDENGGFLPIKGDKFLISAVDCTGHGVPGAFMSMIGYNLLDSITTAGTSHPDRILEKLNKGVRRTLKQEEGNNQDGMDIALCVINKKNKTVEFAGANNPLIYISNGNLKTIKGDRLAIGGTQKKLLDRKYTPHTIKVDHPTWFYILTDGFTDQFGGERGRKFLLKNFKELIFSIHKKPMAEQRKILEEQFQQWRGQEDQIDDVLVIGFKLG